MLTQVNFAWHCIAIILTYVKFQRGILAIGMALATATFPTCTVKAETEVM